MRPPSSCLPVKPEYVAPGGNAYGQRQRAQCLRDYSWYLRLVTYGVLAGSTEMIQEIGLVGAREMYNSLGVPMPGMVEAMKTMKAAALSLLSEQQIVVAGPYFDLLDPGDADVHLIYLARLTQDKPLVALRVQGFFLATDPIVRTSPLRLLLRRNSSLA